MFWWTLQNVLIAALLAGFVWLACHWPRIGPAGRHALWLVVLIKLLTPPLVVWPWAIPDPTGWLEAESADAGSWAVASERPEDQGWPAPENHAWPVLEDEVRSPGPAPGRHDGRPSFSAVLQGEEQSTASLPAVAPAPAAGPLPDVGRTKEPGPEQPSPGCYAAALSHGERADAASLPEANRAWGTAGQARWKWLPAVAAGVWLAGGVALALLQLLRIVRMQCRLRLGRAAEAPLVRKVGELAQRLGIRPPPVRVVPGIGSPMIWALPRPQLVWPAELPAELSRESQAGLIVHELAHIKRHDHWTGWLELAAGCLRWWNPLFWYVRHNLRENAELACDAWVVALLPRGRRAYAEALLMVCEGLSRTAPPLPAVGIGRGSRRSFERRLTMILREKVPFRLSRGGLLAVVLLALAALPVWSQEGATPEIERPVERPAAPALPAVTEESGRAGGTAPPASEAAPGDRAGYGEPALETPGGGYAPAQPTSPPRYPRAEGPATGGGYPGYPGAGAAYPAPPAMPYRTPPVPPRGRYAYQAEPLPADAQALVNEFEAQQTLIRQEVEQKIRAQREKLLAELKELQDRYTREAKLDEAVAIRNWIRQLRAASPPDHRPRTVPSAVHTLPPGVLPDPGRLTEFATRVGERFNFAVTGSTQGTIWGTDVYTTDSPLAVAAVHTGLLQPGQQGIVGVDILPGQTSYEGTTRHGVTSHSWGAYPASYRIVQVQTAHDARPPTPPTDSTTARPDPGTLVDYRNKVGQSFDFEVVGSKDGSIWGTSVYTDDSRLAAAAVHAGVLEPGQKGLVRVTILPGRDSYSGSTRHGVRSQPYGQWGGSYFVEPAPTTADVARGLMPLVE